MIKKYSILAFAGVAVFAQANQPTDAKVTAVPAAKTEVKVAKKEITIYINAMETMQSCQHGIEKLTNIEKLRKDLGTELERREKALQQRMTSYKSKESTLSSSAREKEEAAIIKDQRDLQSLAQSSEDQLKLAMQRATEELSKEIESAAEVVAKQGGYDAVVDTYTGRTIWARQDIIKTADVVKVMDKNYKGGAKAKVTA